MATQLGTNYTKYNDPIGANRILAGKLFGRVRAITDDFTFAGEAAGEVIKIGGDLPAGAIILGIDITNAALGAAVTLDLGDSNDPNRYVSAYDANGNTNIQTCLIGGLHYSIGTNSGDSTILLTTAGGAATGQVKVTILYSAD